MKELPSSGYRIFLHDPQMYLQRSLSRLALFADVKRIKTPEQCRAALKKVDPELFFKEQYEALFNYGERK